MNQDQDCGIDISKHFPTLFEDKVIGKANIRVEPDVENITNKIADANDELKNALKMVNPQIFNGM